MKEKTALRCAGLVIAWYAILQILNVPFRDLGVIRILSIVIMGIIAVIAKRKNGFRFMHPQQKWTTIILISVCLGIGISFLNSFVTIPFILSGEWGPVELELGNFYPNILYGVLGAVVEELFFRGILVNMCRPHYSNRGAIILPAALFTVAHMPSPAVLHTFISGIIFGYLYYYTENIAVPIIAHVTINLMWSTLFAGVLIELTAVKTGDLAAVIIFVLLGVFIIAGMLFAFKKISTRV